MDSFVSARQDCCLEEDNQNQMLQFSVSDTHHTLSRILSLLTLNVVINRKPGVGPSVCNKGHDVESPYYKPLQMCLGGTRCKRWIPIEGRTRWPSRSHMNKTELSLYG